MMRGHISAAMRRRLAADMINALRSAVLCVETALAAACFGKELKMGVYQLGCVKAGAPREDSTFCNGLCYSDCSHSEMR
jgi:hypothetical protein